MKKRRGSGFDARVAWTPSSVDGVDPQWIFMPKKYILSLKHDEIEGGMSKMVLVVGYPLARNIHRCEKCRHGIHG